MSVYFLKKKSNTVQASQKFLADVASYRKVKRIRSNGGTEYSCNDFQTLMRENKIRHEMSTPHQTAERGWHILFEMGNCMLVESKLPREIWHYAIQSAAHIRNRCFSRRTGQTPYQLLTEKKPNVSKLHRFGPVCYTYKQDKKKARVQM